MGLENLIRKGHPVVLGLLIVFSIVELYTGAFLISQFNLYGDNTSIAERDRIIFLLFASAWTILLSALFMLAFFHVPDGLINSVGSHFCFFLVTWAFWTAGAGSLITTLGNGVGQLDCVDEIDFLYCGRLNTLKDFAELIWVLVTLAIVVVIIRGVAAAISHRSTSNSERPSL